MDLPTVEEIKTWDQETANARVQTILYQAGLIFERLEDAGKITGNGHHVAQCLASRAAEELAVRWNNQEKA